MKAVSFSALAVVMVAFAGAGRAQDDNAKKIVGTWEVTKTSGDLAVGTLLEFTNTKEKKINAIIKDPMGDVKLQGTYSIEKDKLTLKMSINNETIEETLTIKRLTEETLEVEDKDKKVDVFKKKK